MFKCWKRLKTGEREEKKRQPKHKRLIQYTKLPKIEIYPDNTKGWLMYEREEEEKKHTVLINYIVIEKLMYSIG